MSMQVKLLRALEENSLRPVGCDKEVSFDVRVLTATNKDLETAVAEDRFREDLYYRINVIQVELPPLRARGADILLLSQHYIERFANRSNKEISGISEQAADKLLSYSWPGNIRELRNVMERAVALTRYDKIAVEDLPEKIKDYKKLPNIHRRVRPQRVGFDGGNRAPLHFACCINRRSKQNAGRESPRP